MEPDRFIIDSSVFVALYYAGDSDHADAVKVMGELNAKTLIIHPYVIAETATVLTYKLGHSIAQEFLTSVFAWNVYIAPVDVRDDSEYFQNLGKKISFTDASLINLANKLNVPIVTFDRQIISLLKR